MQIRIFTNIIKRMKARWNHSFIRYILRWIGIFLIFYRNKNLQSINEQRSLEIQQKYYNIFISQISNFRISHRIKPPFLLIFFSIKIQ